MTPMFLPAKVNFRKRLITVPIPRSIQSPAGVDTAIERLNFTLSGRARGVGGLLVSTGCPRSRRLRIKVTSVNKDGGRVSDSDTFRCRRR